MKKIYCAFSAFIAGALLPLAFAPCAFYPLAIICPALLCWLWLRAVPREAFCYGYLFGLGQFGVGVSWVYISIHQFGGANVALAALIAGLLIFFIALFPALQGYLLTRFFSRPRALVLCLVFPGLWVLLEWVRSWIFTGFPWLLLGASQVSSPLRGFAPMVGEYGLSFFSALSAVLLSLIITRCAIFIVSPIVPPLPLAGEGARRAGEGGLKIISYSFLTLLIIWITGFALTKIQWTHPQSQSLKVALIQGDIPQQMKWDPASVSLSLQRYYQFTQQHWDSQLIIWPENAIPLLQTQAQNFLQKLTVEAQQHQTTLITGIPVQKGFNYYNALLALGDDRGVYYKRHLVPFGEYVPLFSWLGGLLDFLQIPMSNFSAGALRQPELHMGNFIIAPFICYEVVYENMVLHDARRANLLVTISDDAWFGHSFASAQHLQIGRLRALETGRYHLFATNSGITAIIDAQGKILAQAPAFQPAVLTGAIQMMTGVTPIVRLGITPIIILMALLVLLGYWRNNKN
jgi:apolipoprotein N-acyltransferase